MLYEFLTDDGAERLGSVADGASREPRHKAALDKSAVDGLTEHA